MANQDNDDIKSSDNIFVAESNLLALGHDQRFDVVISGELASYPTEALIKIIKSALINAFDDL